MRIGFTLGLVLGFVSLFAQDNRYGKVSKEELSKTQSLINPESPAEILFENAILRMEYFPSTQDLVLIKEIEGRIKIYDKDNVNPRFLTQEVNLRVQSSTREKLSGFRGSTYNLEGGKIVEVKVKNSDIFKEKHHQYRESEKFTFPNVQNGSVLEYKYTITTPFTRDIGRWFFQDEIPIVHTYYSFEHPEFYVYNIDNRGEVVGRIKTSKTMDKSQRFNNVKNEFTYTNVPALKREPYVFNLNNLKTSTRFELMKFEFPGALGENYATSWEQIGKHLMTRSDFGDQIRGNNFLNQSVQLAISNANSDVEKMQSVFQYVKSDFSWNGFSGLTTENGVRSTFKDKTGSAADLNLMLVSMLQKAGLSAEPVVLSTVGNLMLNYSFPSLTSLNYVIASVEIDKQLYLMDATDKFSSINMLPMRTLNHRGFRIGENSVREVSLQNNGVSTIKETIVVDLNPNGKISGNYFEIRDSYFAMNDKMQQVDDPKEFEKSYLEDYRFDVEDFKINENDKGMFRYAFKFNDVDAGEVVGGKLILNPLLFTQLTKPKFISPKRSYPLEFGTLISKEKIIKIKIPEGYKVESLPESQTFLVEGNVAGYTYQVVESEGYILVNTIYQIGKSSLPFTYYNPMKDFESKQINAENQAIVLVKI